MKTPDKVILKPGSKKDCSLVELYGVQFERQEGTLTGMKPLREIAENLSLNFDEFQEILKGYSLLNDKNEISENKCKIEPEIVFPDITFKEIEYSSQVLANVVDVKPESRHKDYKDRNDSDNEPACIYGFERFFIDLINKKQLQKADNE